MLSHRGEGRRSLGPSALHGALASPMGLLALLVVFFSLGLPVASAGAAAPTVLAEAAGEVGYTTVHAHGALDPGAQEAFYRFEYITDSLYRQNVRESRDSFAGAVVDGAGWLPAGTGLVPLAPLLGESGGIESGVEYHLRLVAENAEGSAIAPAPNFITPKPLEPIPCFGDNCQVLPPEPRDPGLSTTAPGIGNPKVHYTRYGSKAKHKKPKHKRHHRARHHQKKKGGKSGPAGPKK